MSKVLLLDIETAPTVAYTWRMWKANISQDMIVEGGYMLSCSMKWLGNDEVFYYENRTTDDRELVDIVIDYLDKADYVIAHNGESFDIPYIKYRAVVHGINPPSPFKIIDTLRIARKEFLFSRNTLANLAKELGVEEKEEHAEFSGFKLWAECLKDNPRAWKVMKKYNIQDVITLEQVYLQLRPWAKEHPNVTVEEEGSTDFRCPKCGSTNIHLRGYSFTNSSKYHKYVCKDCGGWSRTRYTINSIEQRRLLLRSA